MKIILNNSQLAILKEQIPDTEEMLAVEPLIVNYTNYNTDNFRIYFNNISDVSREDIENSEQIILRSDGYDDFIINTNLLSFNYWPNISVDKRRVEITPEEKLPSGNTTISKLLRDRSWQYTELVGKNHFVKQLNKLLKMFGVIRITGELGMFRREVVENRE